MRRKGLASHGCADRRTHHQHLRRRFRCRLRRPRTRRRPLLPRVRRALRPRPDLRLQSSVSALEVAYDLPTGDPERLRSRSRPAPPTSGATPRCCPSRPTSPTSQNLNPGWTKLVKADNLARELGVTGGLFVRTTPATPPTPSRTAWSPRPWRPPRLRLHHPVLLLHRQPLPAPWAPRPPAPLPLLRVHPTRPGAGQRSSWPPSTAATSSASRAPTTTSTASAANPSATRSARAGASSTSTSARTTPRAPRPSRTRSASSSAGASPTRSSSPSPPAPSSPRSTRDSRS